MLEKKPGLGWNKAEIFVIAVIRFQLFNSSHPDKHKSISYEQNKLSECETMGWVTPTITNRQQTHNYTNKRMPLDFFIIDWPGKMVGNLLLRKMIVYWFWWRAQGKSPKNHLYAHWEIDKWYFVLAYAETQHHSK